MFFGKLVVGLVLLAFVPVWADEDVDSRQIWENAETYLSELVTTIQRSVEDSHQRLDHLADQIRTETAASLSHAETRLQVVVDFMAGEVAQIRSQQTDQNRAQLEHCIMLYADEMRRVEDRVRELYTECKADLDVQTISNVDAVRSEVQSHLELGQTYRSLIDACAAEGNAEDCISSIVIDILLSTLEVPRTIEELTVRSSGLLEAHVEELPNCSTSRLHAADVLSGTIIRQITSCAHVVLNPPN